MQEGGGGVEERTGGGITERNGRHFATEIIMHCLPSFFFLSVRQRSALGGHDHTLPFRLTAF